MISEDIHTAMMLHMQLMRLIKPVPPQHPMFTGAKKESASLL